MVPSQGSGENLQRSYAYNSFGDLTALTEDTTSYAFTYDGLGRLTAAYGRTYSYDGANRLTAFNGQQLGYGDAGPYHAVDRIGNADRFDYDANGNMTARNKGLADQKTLVWNAENRLSEVQDSNGNLIESYWYDIDGARVKKVSGATTTYTFFGHYEEEVSGGSTTEIRHYSFGSLRIAVKRGSTLYHLHGDHLGSTSLTTLSTTSVAKRAYYAYGAERSASGDLQTDRTFTGQKIDASGLLYYNARYYDPNLGTFISPDTMVPDPARVIDHNRFLYARGNPLKYTDPSGHDSYQPSEGDEEWYYKNRWYEARGYAWGGGHWDKPINARFIDKGALKEVLEEAEVSLDGSWDLDNRSHWKALTLLAQGLVKLANKIGGTNLSRLKDFTGGGVTWKRANEALKTGTICAPKTGTIIYACALGTEVEFYTNSLNGKDASLLRGTAVHEMAHVIQNHICGANHLAYQVRCSAIHITSNWLKDRHHITQYAMASDSANEYWAESLTDWVYPSYKSGEMWRVGGKKYSRQNIDNLHADLIESLFGGP